jgi:RNA recognition motif-containing protein
MEVPALGSGPEREEMAKKLYVGNLPYTATEEEMKELFAEHGEVLAVNLITDRFTGQPRGFGFVEMEDEGADKAISTLDNTSFKGRTLRVNEARPREGGGGRGGGGGGGGGGRRW